MRPTKITNEEKETLKEMLKLECDYPLPDEIMDEFLSQGRVIQTANGIPSLLPATKTQTCTSRWRA